MPPKREKVPTVADVLAAIELPHEEVQRLFDAVKVDALRKSLVASGAERSRLRRPVRALVEHVKKKQAAFLSPQSSGVVRASFRQVQASVEELKRTVLGDERKRDERKGGYPGDSYVGAYAEALVASRLPPTVVDLESLLLHFVDLADNGRRLPPRGLAILCAHFAPDRFEATIKKGLINPDSLAEIDARVRSLVSKRRAFLERNPRGPDASGRRQSRALPTPDIRGVLERSWDMNPPLVPALSAMEFEERVAARGTLDLERRRGNPTRPRSSATPSSEERDVASLTREALRRSSGVVPPPRNVTPNRK